MEREHGELQQHITRTDLWCENLSHWRAIITTAEVIFIYFFSLFSVITNTLSRGVEKTSRLSDVFDLINSEA